MKTILTSVILLFSFIEGMCEDTITSSTGQTINPTPKEDPAITAKYGIDRTLPELKPGLMYRTLDRIVSATPQGMDVIPAGVQVTFVDMNGFRFMKYGRVVVGVDKIPEGSVEVVDSTNTTPVAPAPTPSTTQGRGKHRTTTRIVDSTPQGLSVIPTGTTVEIVEVNGVRFIKSGRTLISVDKVPEGGLELFDPTDTTPDAPVLPPPTVGGVLQEDLDQARTGAIRVIAVNPVAIAAMGDGLSKAEQELLLKGRPESDANSPQVRALSAERKVGEAAYRLKIQQLNRELSDINASLSKGRIVSTAKTRTVAIETEKARLAFVLNQAAVANNDKIYALKRQATAEAVAYERALAKYNLLVSTK